MNATVSIFTEIPETLHECLKDYLQQHPGWDSVPDTVGETLLNIKTPILPRITWEGETLISVYYTERKKLS